MLVQKVIFLVKYSDYTKVFSKKLAIKFSKCFTINEYSIDLKLDEKPSYNLFYSLDPVELKIFKIYIEINLANILSMRLSFVLKPLSYLFKSLITIFAFI